MIQFKETGLVIEHVWSHIHRCKLMDKRLEEVKKALKNKYYIDYLGVNTVNGNKTHYIANMGHDEWHEYTWNNNLVALCTYFPKHLQLKSGDNGLVYFDCAREIKNYEGRIIFQNDLRAHYVKENKEGYSLAFSTETEGVIQFCFTFSNNLHLAHMDKKTYLQLISDFKYIANSVMKPFMDYYMQYNTIEDSGHLENLINNTPFPILC